MSCLVTPAGYSLFKAGSSSCVNTAGRTAVPGLFEQQRSELFAPTKQARQCEEPLQLPRLKAGRSPRALCSCTRCAPRATTARPSSAENATLQHAFITINYAPGFKQHPSELAMRGAQLCCQVMPPSCSPVPAQTSPRPCPRASELCSVPATLPGQGKLSRGCWCVTGFYGFLEMRDWDLLVCRLPWGVMHVVFIRRAMNCTDACKPASQMLLNGQQQAQLPGADGPALSAAGSRPEHELKQPECH